MGVSMKKMGELMKDLGFNPNSSTAVQEAFLKHLIKAAHGVDVITPAEKKIIQSNPQKIVALKSQQLAFNFEDDLEDKKRTGS